MHAHRCAKTHRGKKKKKKRVSELTCTPRHTHLQHTCSDPWSRSSQECTDTVLQNTWFVPLDSLCQLCKACSASRLDKRQSACVKIVLVVRKVNMSSLQALFSQSATYKSQSASHSLFAICGVYQSLKVSALQAEIHEATKAKIVSKYNHRTHRSCVSQPKLSCRNRNLLWTPSNQTSRHLFFPK